MKPSVLEDKLYEMELKHGKEAFYELPDNHPDIKLIQKLANPGYIATSEKVATWIEQNGDELKELCKEKTVSELAVYYELSNSSIKTRLEKLGLEAIPKIKNKKPKSKKVWDEEALAYIADNYLTMSVYELAKDLGVSVSSVYNKASELGIRKRKAVIMLDLNGDEVRRFEDAKQAEEELLLRAASIRLSCTTGKKYFKHYWEYA